MKKTLLISSLSAMLIALSLSGCATILGGGTKQTISINAAEPVEGQLQYADGEGVQYFTAPATLQVERRSKDIIVKSRDGSFDDQVIKSDLNPWFFGNIIFGGLIGSTTDLADGAAWRYDDTTNLQTKSSPLQ